MAAGFVSIGRRRRGGNPSRNLVLGIGDELKLVRGPFKWAFAITCVFAYFMLPAILEDFWLNVLTLAGIYAIAAVGLNLLTGYCGQVSLGQAVLFGCGAYTAAWFGAEESWPFLAYLPLAALVGFAIGAIIGPFALRLRGNYLAIVTLGLLFVAEHLFLNWRTVTGGGNGTSTAAATAEIGPLNFEDLEIGGSSYTRDQSMFFLVWLLVALTALIVKNIVRSRPGRAMQAVRDRDISAEVIGVRLASTKVLAFAVSSALAAVAGALYAVWKQYLVPTEFGGAGGLFLSITFLVMIIIGGIGTVMGGIIGALIVWGGQQLIARNSDLFFLDPIIITSPGDGGLLSTGEFNNILFGLLIVFFLMIEPRGLAALWFRIKAYFRTWPFRY